MNLARCICRIMNTEPDTAAVEPDSAAVFAAARSLWEICHQRAPANHWNLSESFHGVDQFMREVMRIATLFEHWACRQVNFNEWSEVWPYYLDAHFGAVCLSVLPFDSLMNFNEHDCLRVALALRLPVVAAGPLPVPIDLTASNPTPGAGFQKFRIQTMRDSFEDDEPAPYVTGDDPFDQDYGGLYFALFGIGSDGVLEHLADRRSYAEMLSLAQKLAPAIAFPPAPTFTSS